MAMERDEIKLSTASKTFIAGEYLALTGGPAIVANTGPRFELYVSKTESGTELIGIDEKSPAGQFITKNLKDFSRRKLRFVDPHQGRGGLGASSAQFALCYALSGRPATTEALLESYLTCAWNGIGHAPSGADVLSQVFGSELCLVDRSTGKIESTSWPFPDLNFALIRTGKKVATHLHLNELQLDDVGEMRTSVELAWNGLKDSDESMFLSGLEGFSQHLRRRGWVADSTVELIERLAPVDGVKHLKGCGALGADIVLACYTGDAFTGEIQKLGLEVVATSSDLCSGFLKESIQTTEVSL